MILLFAFFTIFMYQSAGSIMFSNLIYFLLFFKSIISKKALSISNDRGLILWLCLFLIWVTISTSVFMINYGEIEVRNLIQYIFTLQYIMFVVRLGINWTKFELWVYRFSIFLSISILLLFVATGAYTNLASIYTSNRLWAQSYIPGWPNATPIPLLFGLYIGFKKNKTVLAKILLVMALILTTSRGALLGIASIVSYFLYKKINNNSRWKFVILFLPISILLILFSGSFIGLIYEYVPSLEYRMGISYDRQDIFHITLTYLKNRPLLGYGGNSIDQIIPMYGNVSQYGVNWGHTHSWPLETLLRYGSAGLFLFTGMLLKALNSIQDSDDKFMFGLILVLGLFQTYLRNFSVLVLMLYLMDNFRNKKQFN